MVAVYILALISALFSILSGICCLYHLCIGVFGFKKNLPPEDKSEKINKFSALICARNEEKVIANLIKSIKKQKYPVEVDVIVVADNCTDSTAEIAKNAGARVFERYAPDKKTKGQALSWVIDKLLADESFDSDAIAFFDADNVVEENYIAKMNARINCGERMIQGYRDTKNPSDNWLSGAYAIYFLTVMRFCNNARTNLNMSAFLGGTGFSIKTDVLRQSGGWHTTEISEDIEYSIYRIAEGEKIVFAPEAKFFDEQPTKFIQSWHQRVRWSAGMWNTLRKCMPSYRNNKRCFDGFTYLMSVPSVFLGIAGWVFSTAAALISLKYIVPFVWWTVISILVSLIAMTVFALFVVILEKKDIKRNFKGIFGFPAFLVTFMAASAWGVIHPVKRWVPVEHTDAKNIDEICGGKEDGENETQAGR